VPRARPPAPAGAGPRLAGGARPPRLPPRAPAQHPNRPADPFASRRYQLSADGVCGCAPGYGGTGARANLMCAQCKPGWISKGGVWCKCEKCSAGFLPNADQSECVAAPLDGRSGPPDAACGRGFACSGKLYTSPRPSARWPRALTRVALAARADARASSSPPSPQRAAPSRPTSRTAPGPAACAAARPAAAPATPRATSGSTARPRRFASAASGRTWQGPARRP
jgi:hypothetical protein